MPVTEEMVFSFVRNSFRSAWALDLLLLLRRDPQRSWTSDALVRELRGSIALVSEGLASLSGLGLVSRADSEVYAYRPESRELDELVSALVEIYARKPTAVLRAIFTSPTDKIQSFSDAFLLRRGDKP